MIRILIYNYLPDINDRNIKVLLNLDGMWSPHDTLLYDGVDKYYRKKEEVIFCKYLNYHTRKDRVYRSKINNDYIIKDDCYNDPDFGHIFNNRYDKFNNKKVMMKQIMNQIVSLYERGDMNEKRFKSYRIKFEKLEREYKELEGVS